MVMFALKHVLTLRTPMGRKARQAQLGHGVQLIRNKLADLDAAGITRIDRITEVRDGRPVSADGTVPDVATVVWSTGSRPDHSFLDLPLTLADDGLPVHHRGVADEPGLYLIGASLPVRRGLGDDPGPGPGRPVRRPTPAPGPHRRRAAAGARHRRADRNPVRTRRVRCDCETAVTRRG